MHLAPFLLDQWLNHYLHVRASIEFDLGSSTGPHWLMKELLELSGTQALELVLDTKLVYSNAAGSYPLRQAIAEMQGVEPDQVQIVTGASEALLIFFFLSAQPGANVILPLPGFPTFGAVPQSFGLESRFYSLRRENGFRIEVDEITSLVDDQTKLILVNSPHNPTGATLADEELTALHDFAAERGIQLVVDEVYHPIYHGQPTASAARLPHAVVLGDFSKAFCLSGLRIGWMVEHDRHRIEQYCDARSYFTISNSPLNETLATIAVQNREVIFSRARQVTSQNLKLLDQFFAEHQDELDWVRPQGGMTVFPWLTCGGEARSFCKELAEYGVLLAPGDCFGMPNHFRLGFGASGTKFPQAVERFDDFLKKRRLK